MGSCVGGQDPLTELHAFTLNTVCVSSPSPPPIPAPPHLRVLSSRVYSASSLRSSSSSFSLASITPICMHRHSDEMKGGAGAGAEAGAAEAGAQSRPSA